MRLIDADALIAETNKDGAYGYVDAKQIADAPTVDAVPVVRCGECRHKCGEHDGYTCCDIENMWRDPNWYCADGEKDE